MPDSPAEIDISSTMIAKNRGEVKLTLEPEDHPLLASIHEHYMEEWKRRHGGDKLARTYFYHSDVGRCSRSLFYQFKEPAQKRDITLNTILTFRFGDLFHEELQTTLRLIGHTTAKDIEFGTWSAIGFERRGRIDVLLGKVTKDGLVVCDIKSKNSFAFESEPSDAEVDQVMSYIDDCLMSEYFKNRGQKIARIGLLLYVDRGGMAKPPLRLWSFPYSEERAAVIKAEFLALKKRIDENSIPDRPYVRDSTYCQYCRFLDLCWAGVPLPPEAKLEADGSEPPAFEIVQSAATNFVRLKEEIKTREEELGLVQKILLAYCKATGIDIVDNLVKCTPKASVDFDYPFLYKKLQGIPWYRFAKPGVEMLKALVTEGLIDGATFERARKYDENEKTYSLSVYKPPKPKPEPKRKKKEA